MAKQILVRFAKIAIFPLFAACPSYAASNTIECNSLTNFPQSDVGNISKLIGIQKERKFENSVKSDDEKIAGIENIVNPYSLSEEIKEQILEDGSENSYFIINPRGLKFLTLAQRGIGSVPV